MPGLAALREHYRQEAANKRATCLGCDASLSQAKSSERLSLVICRNRASVAEEVCLQVLELLEGPLGLAEAEARIRACDHAIRRDLYERAREEIAEAIKTEAHEESET